MVNKISDSEMLINYGIGLLYGQRIRCTQFGQLAEMLHKIN